VWSVPRDGYANRSKGVLVTCDPASIGPFITEAWLGHSMQIRGSVQKHRGASHIGLWGIYSVHQTKHVGPNQIAIVNTVCTSRSMHALYSATVTQQIPNKEILLPLLIGHSTRSSTTPSSNRPRSSAFCSRRRSNFSRSNPSFDSDGSGIRTVPASGVSEVRPLPRSRARARWLAGTPRRNLGDRTAACARRGRTPALRARPGL